MTTSIILTSQQFTYMQSYESAVNNRKEQSAIKSELLNAVKGALGDLYSRLKQATREALDKLAFLATDRGFAFISYESLSKELNVSRRTIERAIKQLREKGVLAIVYRRNPKGNSVKNPVVMFTAHKYFSQWSEFLGLATPACVVENDVLHDIEENSENLGSSKVWCDEKDATLYLPCTTSLKSLEKIERGERTRTHEKSLERKPDVEIFADIPKLIQVSLMRLGGNRKANNIWKKIVQAYSHSSLYKGNNKSYKLQDLLSEDETFLGSLYAKINSALANYKAGEIDDLNGYIYVVAKNYFNEVQDENTEEYSYDETEADDFYELFPYVTKVQAQPQVQDRTNYQPTIEIAIADELNELGIY